MRTRTRKAFWVLPGAMLLGGWANLFFSGMAWAAPTHAPSDDPMAGLKIDDPNGDTPGASSGSGSAASDLDPSTFPGNLVPHLVVMTDGKLRPAGATVLNGVKFLAFFYADSNGNDSREAAPRIVGFYNDFKKSHPNFELIFVDQDSNADDMTHFMTVDKMPFPAIAFDDIGSADLNAKKFLSGQLPCLVLVDMTGKVLSSSFAGGQYVGPYKVIEQIELKVPATAPSSSSGTAANP